MSTSNTAAQSGSSPSFCSAFRVVHRNGDHWDIHDDNKRLYCIRGEDGRFTVYNELSNTSDLKCVFRTVGACMAYICAELMTANAKGDAPGATETKLK
jgi:hypothetical protein